MSVFVWVTQWKKEEVNKTAVFLVVIWFTVYGGWQNWISREYKREIWYWCSFVGYVHLPLFNKVNTWNRSSRSCVTHVKSPKLPLKLTDMLWIRVTWALARKEKNSVFCMNWEVKCNWGSRGTVSPLVVSVGDQGAKLLENLQYLA